MISGLRVLAIVPARGGSKGVSRKNLRVVGGKPLLAWTIEAARDSRYVDRVVVSSDDDEIMAVASSWGGDVPFRRPAELARDETPGIAPVLHAVNALPGYDLIVLLQPTSPLRQTQDIDACLEELERRAAPSCVSVCEAECHPYLAFQYLEDATLRGFVDDAAVRNMRRQDFPAAWRLNGAVYAARVPWLLDVRTFVATGTVGYRMPTERSLDVDTLEDLAAADARLAADWRS